MHPMFLALVLPATLATLPVKIIAISGSAYVIIAALKKAFPAINGWYALALNIAFSLAGTIMIAKPGDFSDPTFWATLVATIASASGIQGTVKAQMKPTSPSDPFAAGNAASKYGNGSNDGSGSTLGGTAVRMSRAIGVALVSGLLMVSAGCNAGAKTPATAPPIGAVDTIDANANQTLQPIHAFLLKISTDVQSGALKLTAGQLQVLDTANKATNAADAAEIAYHNAGGGSSAALTAALAAAQSAFASIQSSLAAGVTK